jgi:hypothetical protein
MSSARARSFRRSPWVIAAALVVLGAVAMVARERSGGEQTETATARPLGIYSPQRPESLRAEALAALERDARRREYRFLNAVQPGHSFSSTRVRQAALERGDYAPEEIFEIGAQLFNHRFVAADGFGAALPDPKQPRLRRVHLGQRGGPDTYRCATCHRRGGPAGAGDAADNAYLDGDGDSIDSAIERNAISLVGAGLVELLAREMTAELQAIADKAAESADPKGGVRIDLVAKGISFGFLTVASDGSVSWDDVQGVDRDLVVKPFGWKGHAASLREMVEDELNLHHGMQTTHLAEHGAAERVGSFGLPDPDGDGVQDEISEGQLSALTLFIAMQEVPQVGMPDKAHLVTLWSDGQQRFNKLGCAKCHVTSLPLESTLYTLPSRNGGSAISIDLAKHGAAPRLVRPAEGGGYRVFLFSDLKRHVVGPNLREKRRYKGVSQAEFVTRPLWGIVRSRPYLHDARAPTIERAILEHSGEATEARRAYVELDDVARGHIRIYLTSLTRARRIVSP